MAARRAARHVPYLFVAHYKLSSSPPPSAAGAAHKAHFQLTIVRRLPLPETVPAYKAYRKPAVNTFARAARPSVRRVPPTLCGLPSAPLPPPGPRYLYLLATLTIYTVTSHVTPLLDHFSYIPRHHPLASVGRGPNDRRRSPSSNLLTKQGE